MEKEIQEMKHTIGRIERHISLIATVAERFVDPQVRQEIFDIFSDVQTEEYSGSIRDRSV